MNDADRRTLQINRSKIVKELHNIEDVNSKLFEKELFSEGMREEVEAEPTKEKKIRKLLDIVPRRGPTAFQIFIQSLVETKNEFLAEDLFPGASSQFSSTNIHYLEGYHKSVKNIPDDLPTTWPDAEAMETDVKVIYCRDRVPRDQQMTYSFKRNPRGRVLIINNKTFYGPKAKKLALREGTDRDEEKAKLLFEQLHFDVDIKQDLKAEDMKIAISEEVWREEHQNAECFILVILTHGCREGLYGSDGSVVEIEWIKQQLNGINFKVMADKPKIILIQACRGEEFDEGVVTTTGDDSIMNIQKGIERIRLGSTQPDSNKEIRQPTDSHMLIAMATTLDMVSFRNKIYGSWFLQAVIYVFQKYAHSDHILDLMMKVNNLVSKGVARNIDDQKVEYKAISEFSSTLINYLYFNPGVTETSVIAQPSKT